MGDEIDSRVGLFSSHEILARAWLRRRFRGELRRIFRPFRWGNETLLGGGFILGAYERLSDAVAIPELPLAAILGYARLYLQQPFVQLYYALPPFLSWLFGEGVVSSVLFLVLLIPPVVATVRRSTIRASFLEAGKATGLSLIGGAPAYHVKRSPFRAQLNAALLVTFVLTMTFTWACWFAGFSVHKMFAGFSAATVVIIPICIAILWLAVRFQEVTDGIGESERVTGFGCLAAPFFAVPIILIGWGLMICIGAISHTLWSISSLADFESPAALVAFGIPFACTLALILLDWRILCAAMLASFAIYLGDSILAEFFGSVGAAIREHAKGLHQYIGR